MVVVCFIFPCFIHWTDCDTSSAPGCKCGIRNEERRLAKDAREDDNRVVGGETTGVNEYPWMALIVKQVSSTEMGMCGGALINSLWVVTALHCVVSLTHFDILSVGGIIGCYHWLLSLGVIFGCYLWVVTALHCVVLVSLTHYLTCQCCLVILHCTVWPVISLGNVILCSFSLIHLSCHQYHRQHR